MDRTTGVKVLLLLLVLCLHPAVSAHPPSDMQILANPYTDIVQVLLVHDVADTARHYVNTVSIVRNNVPVETIPYTSQPSAGSFTYPYSLPLQEGDIITITARCNIGGSITREVTIPFTPSPAKEEQSLPTPTSSQGLWPVHAALMTAGFLLSLTGVLFPAFRKGAPGWFRYHTRFAAAGVILTLIGICIAFFMVSISGGPNIRVPHAGLGLLVLAFLITTPALGLLRSRFGKRTLSVLAAHRWMGRALLVLMAITILSGLFTAGLIF